ncbi:MAG TPA: c-type cytochrome [Burkholderiaceae bacterium]
MRMMAMACWMAAACVQAAPIETGRRLVATCAACHGTDGAGTGSVLPRLAGQNKDALLASLREFKAGTRAGTVMPQLAKGYTDEQLQQMAAFLAAQPAAGRP